MRSAALLLSLSLSSPATELFTWHVLDTRVVSSGRFELNLHHRTRTRHELSYLEQSRVGPVARWAYSPRLTLIAGYYFQPQQIRPQTWAEGQRVFVGVESLVAHKPGAALLLRGFTERHVHTGRPAFTRYRTALRYTMGQHRVKPFVQNELLAVWPGFQSTRNSGGLSFRLSPVLTMDVSYLYEIRRTFWGGDRQSIVTSLRWTPQRTRR